jgi:hypothetical protein
MYSACKLVTQITWLFNGIFPFARELLLLLLFFFFLWPILGFELSASHLLKPCPQPFFALVISQIGFSISVPADLDHDSPIYASHIPGVTDSHHHGHHVGCDGVLRTICPCWPWTVILSVFASLVAMTLGVRHWAQRSF